MHSNCMAQVAALAVEDVGDGYTDTRVDEITDDSTEDFHSPAHHASPLVHTASGAGRNSGPGEDGYLSSSDDELLRRADGDFDDSETANDLSAIDDDAVVGDAKSTNEIDNFNYTPSNLVSLMLLHMMPSSHEVNT